MYKFQYLYILDNLNFPIHDFNLKFQSHIIFNIITIILLLLFNNYFNRKNTKSSWG